jgi:signal transduction histidine kinase
MEHAMPSPHPTRSATRLAPALGWSSFDITGLRPFAARRKLAISRLETAHKSLTLRKQVDDLVIAERRIFESMALLSHELRSPLASIQNAIAALRAPRGDDAMQERMHELIERQVRQITLLTARLCPMPGPVLESVPLRRERTDLCTVLSRAAETAAPDFTGRQQRFSVTLPESSTWVFGDASRLEQVFINLLSNASKYSDVDGRIAMSAEVCDEHAVIRVCDSGIGIASGAMAHIFDLFVRADATAVRARPGQGIGLALVRSIVEAHDGVVTAASAGVGKGSEFTVRLKLDT